MKKHYSKIILTIILSSFLVSCIKDKNAMMNERDKEYALYYTYKEGDTLRLLSNKNDTNIMILAKRYFYDEAPLLAPSGQSFSLTFNDIKNDKEVLWIRTAKHNGSLDGFHCTMSFTFKRDKSGFFDLAKDTNVSVNGTLYENAFIWYNENIVDTSMLIADKDEGILKFVIDTVEYTKIH